MSVFATASSRPRARLLRGLVALSLAVAAPAALAAWTAGQAPNRAFGTNGVTLAPQIDAAHPGYSDKVFGIAHMPSGGYVGVTGQMSGMTPRLVLTRYTADGQVATSWGTNGSSTYALPFPTGSDTVLVAGRNSDNSEAIFIAATYLSGGINYLYLAKFLGSGALDSSFGSGGYAISNLPNSFANGVGSILAASADIDTFTSNRGLLVVVRGRNSESNVIALVQGNSFGLFEPNNGHQLSRPAIGINQVLAHNGHAELIGTEGNQIVYIDYSAASMSVVRENFFNFSCPGGGAASAAVGDAATYAANLGNDVLLSGRAVCPGVVGVQPSVMRIANVTSGAPTVVWSASLEGGSTNFTTLTENGFGLVATSTEAGEAFVVTANYNIAHVDIATGNRRGSDALFSPAGIIFANVRYGQYLDYPYLVGLAIGGGGVVPGIGSVSLDRMFATGLDQ